jgi:hypothetical protein
MAQFTGRQLDYDTTERRREYLRRVLQPYKAITRVKLFGTAPSEEVAGRARALAQYVRAHAERVSDPRYLIVIVGTPSIPKPRSKDMRAIEQAAARYISVTGTMRVGPAEMLYRDTHGTIFIEKSDEHPYDINVQFREDDPRPPNTPQLQGKSPLGGANRREVVE